MQVFCLHISGCIQLHLHQIHRILLRVLLNGKTAGYTAGYKQNDRILRYGLVNTQTHFEDPQLFIGTVTKGLVRFSKRKGALSFLTGCHGGMQYNQVVEL